jgi:hypothetical protein
MEDLKIYEFFLKLNTYLNRQNHLTNKMIEQEKAIGSLIIIAKATLPTELFNQIFEPMLEVLDSRVKTMNEMKENADGFNKNIQGFFSIFKGIVQ